ncbi:hypothetical protein HALLA_02425 (plasmid) [Halostagnicola larsenii XH-48]|uniref:Peptidase S26 domain-containing protein n=1 Tax=Halostagnicola larsenii XH-48 TaxID=797299 RepID=W0JW12_9EURY|nr:signal peptidase I [Halostagnicola larsenii]AHG01253.1 hypothetical protein HALLA_02425 [Halostagnicola larsenii XH-48]
MSSLGRWLQFALVVLVVLVGLFSLLGQPMLVFVETGSMEPTLEPGDGYVAVPEMFAGEIEQGDVILFEAKELGDDGELTTHRVDAVTDEGYITKGDANPFTDQEDEEPLVQDEQIRSVGLEVGGDLVVVPGLGAVVETITGVFDTIQDRLFSSVGLEPPGSGAFSLGVLGLSVTAYLALSARDTFGRETTTGRSRREGARSGAVVIVVLLLVVLVPLNLTMLLPSGVYQYEIVSSNAPGDGEQTIEAGSSAAVPYPLTNGGQIPMVVILEPASEGVTIEKHQYHLSRSSTESASVTMQAPEETGTHYRFVEETRYAMVLPPTVIGALHSVHPVVALFAINVPVVAVLTLLGIGLLGTGRMRLRSRSRGLSMGAHLRRSLPFVSPRDSRFVRPPPWEPELPNSRQRPADTTEADAESGMNVESGTSVDAGRSADDGGAVGFGTAGRRRVHALEPMPIRRYGWIEDVTRTPPDDLGLDEPEWTPSLLQRALEAASDERYTRIECRRVIESTDSPVERRARTETDSTSSKPSRSGATAGRETDETEP